MKMCSSKTPLEVSCGILQLGDTILAVRRKQGKILAGKYEFPGGKIEPGETPEGCLLRELQEELNLKVDILSSLPPVLHAYAHGLIRLHPFICRPKNSVSLLKDHDHTLWDKPENLFNLPWAEADREVLQAYLTYTRTCSFGETLTRES
ncbi:MAG: (deoxy)nucleoside triphosphate pyrophosphohydrolase [Spirochaetales bacterium]